MSPSPRPQKPFQHFGLELNSKSQISSLTEICVNGGVACEMRRLSSSPPLLLAR